MPTRSAAVLALLIWSATLSPAYSRATAADALPVPTQAPARELPGTANALRANTNAVPALPGAKTAADTFRELLDMSPAERERALADRTTEQRKYLRDCLREYEGLSADQREARLKELELKCHMTILTKQAPEKRAERLKAVPADLRPIVEERLKQWDQLPASVRQEVLEYDTTANYFLRVRPTQVAPPRGGNFYPTPASAVEVRRPASHLSQFLALPAKEQQKAIETLPPGEREEMEVTLKKFAAMPQNERAMCIQSFEKLSQMSKDERNQFLKNAARWKAMSPGERETWRALVEILPPSNPSTELPPTPPGAASP